MMHELRHFRHALALAKHRNFGKAAEAIHLSQSALSRSIASLEDSLGIRLYDRGPGEVALTPAGQFFLKRARELVSNHDELVHELRTLHPSDIGEVAVAITPHVSELCIGPALGRLLRRYPTLSVNIVTLDWRMITQLVLDGTVDFGVAEPSLAEQNARFEVEPVGEHRATLFCRPGHPLDCNGRAPSLGAVFEYPLVGPPIPARAAEGIRQEVGDMLPRDRAGVILPSLVIGDLATARQVVATSDAVSFAPLGLIADDIESGRLVPFFFDFPWLRYESGLVRLANRTLSPGSLALMEEIRVVNTDATRREMALRDRLPVPLDG